MDYAKVYSRICNKAKKELSIRLHNKKSGLIYYEGHHIIPVCFEGSGKSSQYKHENIVLLTAREHFLVHWLLHEMFPTNRYLAFAFDMMCKVKDSNQKRYIPSSRIIEYAKNTASKLHHSKIDIYKKKYSKIRKGKTNEQMYGKKKALEVSAKVSNSLLETYKKDSTLIKRKSISMKGKNTGPQEKFVCPNCGKIGGISTMKQKHLPICNTTNS